MRPIVTANVPHAARIRADGSGMFRLRSVEGTRPNENRIGRHVAGSVMRVTALSPEIGYDAASAVAHAAIRDDLTQREAALRSGAISGERFDEAVDPGRAVGSGSTGA